jgi:hypothetical protein
MASPIFWGLRILARFLLSYSHLSTDTAERHILIETYLALHKEGKVKDEDRELLLAAIFRPASTGESFATTPLQRGAMSSRSSPVSSCHVFDE